MSAVAPQKRDRSPSNQAWQMQLSNYTVGASARILCLSVRVVCMLILDRLPV